MEVVAVDALLREVLAATRKREEGEVLRKNGLGPEEGRVLVLAGLHTRTSYPCSFRSEELSPNPPHESPPHEY